jgi:hypothetical protein
MMLRQQYSEIQKIKGHGTEFTIAMEPSVAYVKELHEARG